MRRRAVALVELIQHRSPRRIKAKAEVRLDVDAVFAARKVQLLR